jgi:hypothetical protein
MKVVSIAEDFTRFPAGRYRKNGSTSGEEFRMRFLEEPLRKREEVTVRLDGTIGYGSSFLEEAFGGIVRSLGFPASEILNRLKLDSSDSELIGEIVQYIKDAGRAQH